MDKIKDVAQRWGIITVEDMERYTALELIMMIANKMNEFNETINDQNEKIQYLLSEGLLSEVEQIFNEWTQDGTFDRLINESALQDANNRIESVRSRTLYMSDIPREKEETDDTGRIRRAFDMVRTKEYKTIFFNSGDYIITPPTNLSEYGIAIPNNVKLVGEDGAKIKTQSAVAYPALFTLDIGEGAENVCIENIEFDNTEDTHKTFINSDKNACMLLKINNIVGDICIKDCTFTSYSQNPVVSFPFHRSEGKVSFIRNKFYFKRHIDEWYDATMLSIGHYDVEYIDNYFESINNGTKTWVCNTAFEIHSRKCRAHGNDCYNFGGGCLIVGVPPYLPLDNTVKSDIKVYNNNFVNVNSGIQVWGDVVPSIADTTINNIDVYENNIVIQHDHNYKPLTEDKPTAGYGLSLKVVGNVKGYENIKFHHNTLDFVQIGEHNYSSSDLYLTQRGAISLQTNVPTKNIFVYENVIKNYPYEAVVVGNDYTSGLPYNLFIRNNVFVDCSYGAGIPLFSFNNCDSLHVTDNFIVNETKKYDSYIYFSSPSVHHLTLLNNIISSPLVGGYDMTIRYDEWTNMSTNLNTMNHDVITLRTIADQKTPRIFYKATTDGMNLFKGDIVFLTSGDKRMAVVTSDFANTKSYEGMKVTKSDGVWLTVNNIHQNIEVGDAIVIGGETLTIVSCIDYSTNKIKVMRSAPIFENQEKTVAGSIGSISLL